MQAPKAHKATQITKHFPQALFCFKACWKETFCDQEQRLHKQFPTSNQPTRTEGSAASPTSAVSEGTVTALGSMFPSFTLLCIIFILAKLLITIRNKFEAKLWIQHEKSNGWAVNKCHLNWKCLPQNRTGIQLPPTTWSRMFYCFTVNPSCKTLLLFLFKYFFLSNKIKTLLTNLSPQPSQHCKPPQTLLLISQLATEIEELSQSCRTSQQKQPVTAHSQHVGPSIKKEATDLC